MKCPMIKKCGGCFYPQDQYQEALKEKTLFIEKEVQKAKLKIEVKPTVCLLYTSQSSILKHNVLL